MAFYTVVTDKLTTAIRPRLLPAEVLVFAAMTFAAGKVAAALTIIVADLNLGQGKKAKMG